MSILFNHLQSNLVLNFTTNIFHKLTPLQKKVSVIALVCVGYLALFYLARCLASCGLLENKIIVRKVNKPEREKPILEKLEQIDLEEKIIQPKNEQELQKEAAQIQVEPRILAPVIIDPFRQKARNIIEQLRSHLIEVTENAKFIGDNLKLLVWVNKEGYIQALDSTNRLWVGDEAKPKSFIDFCKITGTFCLDISIRSLYLKPIEDNAFITLCENNDCQVLSEEQEQLKAIFLQELNLLARGALAIAQEKGLQKEENQKNQPWFEQVLCNKILYPSAKLRLMAVNVHEAKVEEEAKIQEDVRPAEELANKAAEYFPIDMQINRIALAAVQQDGLAFQYAPREMINNELCLAAVQQDGLAFQYAPREMINNELYLAAVKQNGFQNMPAQLEKEAAQIQVEPRILAPVIIDPLRQQAQTIIEQLRSHLIHVSNDTFNVGFSLIFG